MSRSAPRALESRLASWGVGRCTCTSCIGTSSSPGGRLWRVPRASDAGSLRIRSSPGGIGAAPTSFRRRGASFPSRPRGPCAPCTAGSTSRRLLDSAYRAAASLGGYLGVAPRLGGGAGFTPRGSRGVVIIPKTLDSARGGGVRSEGPASGRRAVRHHLYHPHHCGNYGDAGSADEHPRASVDVEGASRG